MFLIYRTIPIEVVQAWLYTLQSQVSLFVLWGPILIFGLRFMSIVIPILPGTYCSVLSGYFFGIPQGLAIIFVADLIACSTSFTLSRRLGRNFIKTLVGKRLMNRVEKFSKNHLEQNFFLLTGLLMSNFFDFVCYGVGLSKIKFRQFLPALVFSILISDTPFVFAGYSIKKIGKTNVQEILSGNATSLQGMPLILFIATAILIFCLAIINIKTTKNNSIDINSRD